LGSGTSVAEVNRLLKQFGELQRLVKQVTRSGKKGRVGRGLPLPGFR